MPVAPVTPAVLTWAIDESGLSVPELAERLDVKSADITAWMEGAAKPTKGQVTELAKNLRRPRAMFFLPEAPVAGSLPAGLRNPAGEKAPGKQELTFKDRLQMRRARRLQAFLATLTDSKTGIPTADQGDQPEDVGKALRGWTGVTRETQQEWETAAQAFRGWREAVEARGVAVLALQIGRDGIRGFALVDEGPPVIAVNTADIPEARCFTLLHELAHLALDGDRSCAEWNRRGVEQWCDRVASHVLIPRPQLRSLVDREGLDGLDLVRRAANRFRVSRRAAAVALEDVGAMEDAYSQVKAAWPSFDRKKSGGGGGNLSGRTSPRIRIDEYGSFVVGSVLRALDSGAISELVASDYLRLDRTQLGDTSQLLSELPA